MPGPHPTDRDLASLIDGGLSGDRAEAVHRHVRGCPRCQLRIGAADEGLLGRDWAAPEPVPVVILQESAADPPASGEVWRLTWDANSVLTVIWRVDSDRISVLPVLDSADADEWSALLDPQVTGGLGELAVSVALETAVPWSVLDTRIARIVDANVNLGPLRSAFRSGTPTAIRRGDVVRSPFDDRLVGLEALAETMSELANAIWAPVSDVLTTTSLDFDALTSAGIAVNRALAIVRGAMPDDDESNVIEAATGVRPDRYLVDDELRRAIDQPRRKAKIRARAAANRRGEGPERLVLAQDAQPALAAARGTHGAAPDYDTILDRLLND